LKKFFRLASARHTKGTEREGKEWSPNIPHRLTPLVWYGWNLDQVGSASLQGSTMAVLLIAAWASIIKGKMFVVDFKLLIKSLLNRMQQEN
jgi:hypothetical protein